MKSNEASRLIAVALLSACLGLGAHSAIRSTATQTTDAAHWELGNAVAIGLASCEQEKCEDEMIPKVLDLLPEARITWVEDGTADEFGISRGQVIARDTLGDTGKAPSPELAEDVNATTSQGISSGRRLGDDRIRVLAVDPGNKNRVVAFELDTPFRSTMPGGWAWALAGGIFALLAWRKPSAPMVRAIPMLSGIGLIAAGYFFHQDMLHNLQETSSAFSALFGEHGLSWNAKLEANGLPFETVVFGILLGAALGSWWVNSMEQFVDDLRHQPTVYAYVTPAVLATVILVFVPFMAGIGLAFFHAGPGDPSKYVFAGMSNFGELLQWEAMEGGANTFQFASSSGETYFTAPKFYFTLVVTILWTLFNVALHLGIGLGLALLLNRPNLRFKKLYRVLLIVPWAVPSYITALTWRMMFHTEYGTVNHVMAAVGMSPVDWLGSGESFGYFASNFAANLATNTWLGFPFMMVVSLGALQSIPAELYEAASIDGASRRQKFKFITLPLLKPALLPAVLLGSIWTFNMFNVVYLVSRGAPFGKTNILITEAFRYFNADKNYGMAAAYSVVIFLILLGYASVTNRVTKATEGALK